LCNSCPECRKTVDAVQAGIKPPFHFSKRSSKRLHAGHSSGNLLTAEKRNPFLPDFKKLLANPRHERYIPPALQMRG
jgi:hypothetical protein